MKENVNKGLIARTLDWAYGKTLSGFGGVDSAYALADSYLSEEGDLEQQVNSLIRWQTAKAAASGFTMGLGGLMTMPLTVPMNVASVIYMQIRMITAIAHMGGHDVNSDKVRSMVYICMVGNGAKELLKDIGLKVGEKLTLKVAAKFAEKSMSSFAKALPIAGGVLGASFDAVATRIVGKVAKKIFIEDKNELH